MSFVRNFGLVVILLSCVSGCSFLQPHKYDPQTVNQVDITVTYENSAFALLNMNLDSLVVADPAKIKEVVAATKNEIAVRHNSEIARLNAWKVYEAAKSGAPVSGGTQ